MKILLDQSPWYLSFEDESVQEIRSLVPQMDWTSFHKFKRLELPVPLSMKLIRCIPFYKKMMFIIGRVSLFITPARTYYRAHKDGFNHQVGINYPIQILDDQSITRWYGEELSKEYEIDSRNKRSREVVGFDFEKHTPECSFTMKPTEAVLFNVDRFHDFHNFSNHPRVLLTFRSIDPLMNYEKAAQLFTES